MARLIPTIELDRLAGEKELANLKSLSGGLQQSILRTIAVQRARELAAGTLYVLTANRTNDAWTVTHANNAQVDRSYQVAVIG